MAPDPSDTLLGVVLLALGVASVGTWFYLFDRLQHGPILSYEPRRPVPWHGVWALLPLALVVLTIVNAVYSAGAVAAPPPGDTSELVQQIAWGSAQQTAFVIAFLAVMLAVSRATRADLGLPKNFRELVGDIRIGVVAWLAALVPVYGMQLLLVTLFGHAEGHPLIQMIEEHASPTLFALAFAAAVVVAPICEELMFRLVLQGWLEKWEDLEIGWRTPPRPPIELLEVVTTEAPPDAAPTVMEIPFIAEELVPVEPPRTGVGGLPYGWLPIGVSSLLFALAHVGWGPDPVALFLLALILGYVYQRTHRILPAIMTHALFNGMALFMLWRVMSAGGR